MALAMEGRLSTWNMWNSYFSELRDLKSGRLSREWWHEPSRPLRGKPCRN